MLIFKHFRSKETFAYKYLIVINNKKFNILSNFDNKTMDALFVELKKIWDELDTYEILDCIEFEYTDENDGITLDALRNYL